MKLKKGKETINLSNPIQIAAYLSSGWTEVKKESNNESEHGANT